MSKLTLGAMACILGLAAAPVPAAAQAGQQAAPEMRYVTVTAFRVPLGPDRGAVMQWIEKWMVPPARLNPNVLSYRVAGHNYGNNASDVMIIAEYPSWEAIEADCAPCDEWFRANPFPKEGTPERKAHDEMLATFLKYYSTHADQLLQVNMTRFGKK